MLGANENIIKGIDNEDNYQTTENMDGLDGDDHQK